MKTVKAKNALRAVLTAWALFVDLNLRSGNNYVNLGESLTGTSGAVALAAMAVSLNQGWFSIRVTKRWPTIPVAPMIPTLYCFIANYLHAVPEQSMCQDEICCVSGKTS